VSELDPITAEIIVSALAYASEEMGIAVRNAAYSRHQGAARSLVRASIAICR